MILKRSWPRSPDEGEGVGGRSGVGVGGVEAGGGGDGEGEGVVVSIVKVTELLLSDPLRLLLPAESVKAPRATVMTPSEVLSVFGVKVAV